VRIQRVGKEAGIQREGRNNEGMWEYKRNAGKDGNEGPYAVLWIRIRSDPDLGVRDRIRVWVRILALINDPISIFWYLYKL
jgi:hypothetical protein